MRQILPDDIMVSCEVWPSFNGRDSLRFMWLSVVINARSATLIKNKFFIGYVRDGKGGWLEAKHKPLVDLKLFEDITKAWDTAAQDHRNRLCKYLLESIWIKDKMIMAVTPRPEFKPFFDLQYAGKSNYELQVRPRGDSNPRSPP